MKIKNIAILHPTLGYKGGAENLIIWAIKEWQKYNIKTIVYTARLRDDLINEIEQRYTNIKLNPFTLNKTANFILDSIADVDAVLIHNFPATIFWGKVYDIAKSKNIILPKSFWYCHEPSVRLYGSDECTYKKLQKTIDPIARYTMHLERYGISKVDKIFANSCRTQAHIKLVYNRESSVIYPCSPVDMIQSRNKNKKHFFYIGRIEKPKNIDIAIRCFKKFLDKSDDKSIKFFIAGKGRYENYIKSYIEKMDISNNVKMLGYITDEEKNNYIENAYALISIAEREPFGLNVIEAWAMNTTAIISKYCGAAEIVENNKNAISINVHDEKSIVDSMLHLVMDEAYRNSIYDNGLNIIESKKFSISVHAQTLLRNIDALL